MDTMARIKRLFIDKIEVREELLKPETTLENLGIDSLDTIEFLFSLEEEFHIKIDDRSKSITTIQDVVNLIDIIVAEQRPAVRA
ncbi:MAG TPA: acyl carrier protein [Nitrospirota bacterium]|nr:acyl carrier protein [Nitrospirota bacterium]